MLCMLLLENQCCFLRILEMVKRVGLNAHAHCLPLICRMGSSAVSLTLVREQHFVRVMYYYYGTLVHVE